MSELKKASEIMDGMGLNESAVSRFVQLIKENKTPHDREIARRFLESQGFMGPVRYLEYDQIGDALYSRFRVCGISNEPVPDREDDGA